MMDFRKLSDTISNRIDASKEETALLFSALTNCIGEAIANQSSVNIPGFGAFEPRKRAERIMTSPSTGKRMLVPPKIAVGFKPSGVLKQKVK